MRVAIFDLETRKLADEVEGGWDAIKRGEGGITAVAVWDTKHKRMALYDEHTIEACAMHLEAADLVVGYNSASFDIPIIEGVLGRKLRLKHSFDILISVWEALRARGDRKVKGNKLDEVARRTIGRGKTGSGAMAPELARQGRWAELFSYCMNDTELTRDLFEHIVRTGGVNDLFGNHLTLKLPTWLMPKDEAAHGS